MDKPYKIITIKMNNSPELKNGTQRSVCSYGAINSCELFIVVNDDESLYIAKDRHNKSGYIYKRPKENPICEKCDTRVGILSLCCAALRDCSRGVSWDGTPPSCPYLIERVISDG